MAPKARVQKRLYYKIGEACKALDIQPYVLRYWETEFPALSPSKSRSGQRVYSEKEIGIIRRIKELLYEEGYTIAGAKKKLEAELASGSLGGADQGEEGEETAAELSRLPGVPPGGDPADATARGKDLVDADSAAAEPASPLRAASRPRSPRPTALPADSGVPSEKEPGQQPLLLDTQATERIESMRKEIQQAVDEARELLAFLAAKSPPSSSI
jgi:DNA-binding transcriptional MerR regulator